MFEDENDMEDEVVDYVLGDEYITTQSYSKERTKAVCYYDPTKNLCCMTT